MAQCTASTTKKAWRNPLAPMARCTREAVTIVRRDYGYAVETQAVCRLHARKLIERGAVEVIDASPSGS